MQQLLLAPAVAGILAMSSMSQQFIETFSYPDGPVPPASGWTAQSGNWLIRSGRVVQTTSTWGYLTKNNVQALNCVVDTDCFWVVSGLQFAGTAARHPGTAANNAVMVKVQANSAAATGFDAAYNYELPGGFVARTGITPAMTNARVRLIALRNEGMMWIDADQNGTWDFSLGPKTLTAHTAPGLVGLTGFSSPGVAELDNAAFFDAVCVAATGSSPIIGTTYKMDLHTPAPVNTPYVAALSLTPGRTVLPDGRALPFGFDALANLTLSLGSGIGLGGITDGQGFGSLTFPLPNNPTLIGVRLVASAFTIDGTRPLGIGSISNDHQFVIQ